LFGTAQKERLKKVLSGLASLINCQNCRLLKMAHNSDINIQLGKP